MSKKTAERNLIEALLRNLDNHPKHAFPAPHGKIEAPSTQGVYLDRLRISMDIRGMEREATMLSGNEPSGEAAVAVWRAATELFEGDRAAAERWLHKEAMGLGGKRPIDVMQADPKLVLDLMGRLEHEIST